MVLDILSCTYASQIYTESAVVKLPAVEEYLTTMIDVREIPQVQSILSLNKCGSFGRRFIC